MTPSLSLKIDPARVTQTLRHDAVERLKDCGGELTLDFSGVRRVDAADVQALEELSELSGQASVRIALGGVNISVYRALRLLGVTTKFSFLA